MEYLFDDVVDTIFFSFLKTSSMRKSIYCMKQIFQFIQVK